MSDRKAELEKKKAKLQAIREEKERRRKEREQKEAEEAASRKPNPDKDQRKVDEMLSSLGIAPVSGNSEVAGPLPKETTVQLPTSSNEKRSQEHVLSSLSSVPSVSTPEAGSATATPDASLQPASQASSGKKKSPQLMVVSVQSTSIPPKETVVYTKQTQTTQASTERDGYYEDWFRPRKDEYNLNPGLEWEDEFTVLTYDEQAEDEESSLPPLVDGFQSKLPPGILPHGLPKVKDMEPAITSVETEQQQKKEVKQSQQKAIKKLIAIKSPHSSLFLPMHTNRLTEPRGFPISYREQYLFGEFVSKDPLQFPVRELSDDEKMMIVLSEDFQRCMDRTGRIMERALAESTDIYTDYTGISSADDLNDDKAGGKVSLSRWFFDERWSRTRCVTSLDWSPQYPELLLASYHTSVDSAHDPDGVCLVWNTKFKKTSPEYVFHCQSTVLSATFARFHPNLILGGTYSGQVVLWDNRVQKRTPIQRTPLSATAHTHPVYCMEVVGTPNAHNLISVSTDGRLCSWSLDMLSQPQETLELQHRQSKAIAVTSLDFPYNDVNNFVLGSEEGAVYSACRHGTKAGVTDTYDGHQGPITGINTHKVQGPVDYSHLFLTSSFDWTIKLWNMKENKAVYSFEDNGDYVYDVGWSPVHPSVFASVDGSGRLDLWDLNTDTEVPVATAAVDQPAALNRLAWSASGNHIAAGDDHGKIHLYDIPEHLSVPRADEWNKLLVTLQELKNNQADDELDKMSLGSGPSSLTSFVPR